MTMCPELAAFVDRNTSKINPDIGNGLAVKHMAKAPAAIDEAFRSVQQQFPKDLKYIEGRRCTPEDDFNISTTKGNKKQGKRVYDTAKTDFCLYEYIFDYRGQKISSHLYLPFVREAGYTHIGGSRFCISPVLADKVISIDHNNVFARLDRDRLIFKRLNQRVVFNGFIQNVPVVNSQIYHSSKIKKSTRQNQPYCSLTHYLFAKYGMTETFRRFGKCEIKVLDTDVDLDEYPPDTWTVCTTGDLARNRNRFMSGTTLRVLVKNVDLTPKVKTMIASFFYITRHFGDRIKLEYIDHVVTWIRLLGLINIGDIHEGRLLDDMYKHMESLDSYLDIRVNKSLKDIGVNVSNIYELFDVVNEKYNDWVVNGAGNVASKYDKEINILYYVLYDIIRNIFMFNYRLSATAAKKRDKGEDLTHKDIESIITGELKKGRAYKLAMQHPEVSSMSTSGDNMAFKVTSVIVPQADMNRTTGKNSAAKMNDPMRGLHSSVAEVCSHTNITKADPLGTSRINLKLQIDDKNMVVRNPVFKELLDKVQETIEK